MKATKPQSANVKMNRAEAAALLSAVEIALQANRGKAPASVTEPLYEIVERINVAFDFGIGEKSYRVAFVTAAGGWDVVETFTAVDDDAANAYAEENYAGQDWYVLNDAGRNINGGRDQN